MSILFDEKNCHAQCYACNVVRRGNLIEYYRFMQGKYGEKTIQRLIQQEKGIVKLSVGELLDIADKYNGMSASMMKGYKIK